MVWFAWVVLALAVLVIIVCLWITWIRIMDASRRPDDPWPAPRRRLAANTDPASVLERIDEQGYLYRRMLPMGCEAAVARTPFGARIVAGKKGLQRPQYAWDYTSIRQAQRAMVHATFGTDPADGVVVGGAESSGTAEPNDYIRRWIYAPDGSMQRF